MMMWEKVAWIRVQLVTVTCHGPLHSAVGKSRCIAGGCCGISSLSHAHVSINFELNVINKVHSFPGPEKRAGLR